MGPELMLLFLMEESGLIKYSELVSEHRDKIFRWETSTFLCGEGPGEATAIPVSEVLPPAVGFYLENQPTGGR